MHQVAWLTFARSLLLLVLLLGGSLLFHQELLNFLEFTFVCRANNRLGVVRLDRGTWESCFNYHGLGLTIFCAKLRLRLVKGRWLRAILRIGRNF